MDYLVFVIPATLLACVYLYLRFRTTGYRPDNIDAEGGIQQQIRDLQTDVGRSLENTTQSINNNLRQTTEVVFRALEQTQAALNQQILLVTNQMTSVSHQLQAQGGQVGDGLNATSELIQRVHNRLGELQQATVEMKELGQSISKLENLLQAPKLRGGLGELLLEELLRQVLPASSFELQYTFKGGQTVDAIIRTSGGLVPVDSKFPLENFRKMTVAGTDAERRMARRQFVGDLKGHVDAIAQKYIRPDEGTFDFALMYIPAENVYYEAIIKDESDSEEQSIQSYASARHVIPVSPNSFYAHLKVVALGLKGLRVEESAKEILQNLQRISRELKKFSDVYETLGTHLNNARTNYEKGEKLLNNLAERLEHLDTAQETQTLE